MKKFTVFAMLVIALFALPAFSQTAVQQSPSRPDACSTINATAAVANAVTLTLTPPNGQFVYLCGVDLTVSADGTAGDVCTNCTFTSTNLGGWLYKVSFNTTTANQQVLDKSFFYNIPLKSAAAGTALTLVSPASKTHDAYSINAYYYFAP